MLPHKVILARLQVQFSKTNSIISVRVEDHKLIDLQIFNNQTKANSKKLKHHVLSNHLVLKKASNNVGSYNYLQKLQRLLPMYQVPGYHCLCSQIVYHSNKLFRVNSMFMNCNDKVFSDKLVYWNLRLESLLFYQNNHELNWIKFPKTIGKKQFLQYPIVNEKMQLSLNYISHACLTPNKSAQIQIMKKHF